MSESSERASSDRPMTDAERLAAADQLELKLPDESSAPKDLALWAGVLALLTLIVYWPATNGSFLWRDDRVAMSRQFVGPGALPRIWSQRWDSPTAYGQPMYQPVAFTAYWLEYQLGGHAATGAPSPMAYHIASLVFHVGSAVLLWLVLRELKMPGAWLIAAVYTLHAVHAEAVSWISEQPTVLAQLFFFGAVYTYLLFTRWFDRDVTERSLGRPGVDPAQTWGFFAAAIALCLLAMLSHPSAVVFPAVIFLILWWKNRITRIDVTTLAGLFFIGTVLWFKNLSLQASPNASLIDAGLNEQMNIIGRAMVLCVVKLIIPFGLSILHSTSSSSAGLIPLMLIAGALVAAYAFQQKIGRGAFAALAIFALLVVSCTNWFDASRITTITDASASLAILPLLVIAIGCAANAMARAKLSAPPVVVTVSALLLVLIALPSWFHTHAFESPITLWRDTLKKHPASLLAQASLAEQLRLQSQIDAADQNKEAMDADLNEAVQHAQAALAIDPTNAAAEHTWASILVGKGDDAAALPHFQSAIHHDPNNALLRADFGSALVTLGRLRDAIAQLNESLRLDPSSAVTHRLLGKAYFGLNNYDRAISEAKIAVGIDPTDPIALQQLAEAQAQAGKLKDALDSYGQLGQLDPSQLKRPDLCIAMARIKDRQFDYAAAMQFLEIAQQTAPDDQHIKDLLAAESEKQRRFAATRPTTRGVSGPSTTQVKR